MTLCVKYKTKSADETKALAENLARILLKKPNTGKNALVLALNGDLGSGKTTFAQGFAMGLGIEEKITSPTFVIMKRFKIYDSQFKNFYHVDTYRLKNEKDATDLGLKDILANPTNIVLIEWPERLKKTLPKKGIQMNLKHKQDSQKDTRAIDIYNNV